MGEGEVRFSHESASSPKGGLWVNFAPLRESTALRSGCFRDLLIIDNADVMDKGRTPRRPETFLRLLNCRSDERVTEAITLSSSGSGALTGCQWTGYHIGVTN